MKKAVSYMKVLLLCVCTVFFLKCDLAEANQIYEATEFKIGSTITNNTPEYMNYYKLYFPERKTIDVTCVGYSNMQDIYRLYLYDSNFEEIDFWHFWKPFPRQFPAKFPLFRQFSPQYT